MNIIQLYQDYAIDHLTEGNKHCSPGWVQVHCPYCSGSQNYHLGYNISENYFNCYRCGWKPIIPTIAKLLNVSTGKAGGIISQYGGLTITPTRKETPVILRLRPYKLPQPCGRLQENHKRYLEKRGFDPELLERTWGLVGTGPVSLLDGIDYKHRIIAPIVWNGKQVSFQGRDITDKQTQKYMACPKPREITHHKHILYGKEREWKETGIIVEGIFDVWRFGTVAAATFGIEFTNRQVHIISTRFKRVAVCFDGGEPQAAAQADKLVAELKFRRVDSWRVDIEGDPGEMDQDEADYLVKQLTI